MGNDIKHAEVVPNGVFITFKDGRQALLDQTDLADCAEESQGFAKAERVQAQADAERAEED